MFTNKIVQWFWGLTKNICIYYRSASQKIMVTEWKNKLLCSCHSWLLDQNVKILNRLPFTLKQLFPELLASIMIFCQFSNGGCQLQLQFSRPFLHQFSKSLCPWSRGYLDDSKTPPEVIFLMILGWENSKKRSGAQNWISKQF